MSPPTLTDGRVVLDRHTLDDAPAILAGEDEEHARRFGWYPNRSSLESVQAAIMRWGQQWETEGAVRAFAIRSAESDELVGGCEARRQEDGTYRLSYWVFPTHRGCGFASSATRLLTEYVMSTLGAARVALHIEVDNLASRGVARNAGFAEAGPVPEEEVRPDLNGRKPQFICFVRTADSPI